MKQRWPHCIGARLFTSAQLASTVSSKVYQCPNSNFYTSNCFKCKPNMQTLSHSQHTCDAYPMTLQPTSASQRQDKSRGLEKSPNCCFPMGFSDPETLCQPPCWYHLHIQLPSPTGLPLPSSPSGCCPAPLSQKVSCSEGHSLSKSVQKSPI